MTHEESRLRAKKIADFMAEGHTYRQGAKKFKTSTPWVATCCKRFGVQPVREKRPYQKIDP